MKQRYKTVSMREIEARLGQTILTGSITFTKVAAPKESVTVTEFKDDKSFQDNGFGDISF